MKRLSGIPTARSAVRGRPVDPCQKMAECIYGSWLINILYSFGFILFDYKGGIHILVGSGVLVVLRSVTFFEILA